MKYVRTHETRDKFLADKDSTSRGFRLAPTLYKYSDESEDEDNRDHIYLELDDPRKHEGSTYMEIALNSDVEFSFYIGNKSGDKQTTMTCTIDWGDDTTETRTITKDTHGFKLAHNYVAGSYKIELYGVEKSYVVSGNEENWTSLISPIESIERVVLSSSFIIGHDTFGGCTSLTSVYISEGATSIGDYAFNGCASLTSIYIPNTVNRIGEGTFWGCKSLKSANIHESVTSIEIGAFAHCTSLLSIYIPESVTSIGDWPFQYCTSLSSIYIPDSVNSIGWSAFGYCKSLTSIHIPKGVTIIKFDTFKGCSSLTSINIPERVTSIEYGVFNDCISLKSISSFNTIAPTLSTTNSEGNLVGVFTNLPTNGTLHIKPGATGYDAWLSKLPSGWTIVEDL